MAARKHNPGPSPQRGEVAGTVVSVRLTAAELAHLDSLWPHPGRRVVRGEVIRNLIACQVRCGTLDPATGSYL